MSVMLSQPPLADPVSQERQEPDLKVVASFEPKIVGLVCNWCSYAGADLAGTSRIQYPPNIRLVRVMCTGSVDPLYILRPLMDGADGVLVGG
ncbi:hypothetical protein J2Z49_000435 [Desulfofundulus luciae]|jgi:hypothetical protein|uniref:Methyl-viologen-reducing hydrogenase, delta subunit n=3 Tax=Desulfofundulus TaxID=2282741 RepID=A0A1M6DTN6_9FIRM|nr:hypothetical protein [Desulfofundulus luciae]SHI76500.1 Methyl-viologen-reducing hydrogenase, delta subunit [Desulfofundulus thermosubterraneus DSM 16057]